MPKSKTPPRPRNTITGTLYNIGKRAAPYAAKYAVKKASDYAYKKAKKFIRKVRYRKHTVRSSMKPDRSTHNDLTLRKLPNVKVGKFHKAKLTSTMKYQENYNKVIRQFQGGQAVDVLEVIGNRFKLYGVTDTARNQYLKSQISQWDLSTQRSVQDLSTGAALNSKMRKLFYSHVNATYEFVNFQSVPIKIIMHLLTPVHDCEEDPYQVWDRQGDNSAAGAAAISEATTLGGSATPGMTSPQVIQTSPGQSREFRKMWKTLIRKEFVIQPGDQINYTHIINIKKVYSRESLDSRTSSYLRGFTVIPMIVAQAGLVGLTPVESEDATQVGYAFVNYGVMVTYKHCFRALATENLNTLIVGQEATIQQEEARQFHINDNDDAQIVKDV